MKTLVSAVFWRYIAIAMQFGVLILIARRTQINVAGVYFAIFGFVTVTSVGVGLGMPDGLVRHLPVVRLSSSKTAVRALVHRSVSLSVVISIVLAATGCVACQLVLDLDTETLLLAAAWWMAYACTFLCAQVMVALERPATGAFIAYSSISMGYALTVVPFTLLADTVSLHGLLVTANVGAWLATAVGSVLVLRTLRAVNQTHEGRPDGRTESRSPGTRTILATGFPIMVGRFMQASLPWIPVWVLLALASAAEAATYSAASRLTVAVTSVVAALRFSVRPTIVDLNTKKRYREIALLNRKCSLISALPPLAGLLILIVAGNALVPLVLGSEYRSVRNILMVLMVGVIAEAFGGMSDEILKMTGKTHILLYTLAIAISFQIAASYALATYGALAVAFATATAFAIQYVGQVLWLSIRTPIKILPIRRTALTT